MGCAVMVADVGLSMLVMGVQARLSKLPLAIICTLSPAKIWVLVGVMLRFGGSDTAICTVSVSMVLQKSFRFAVTI